MTAFERWDVVTALFPFTDIAVRRPRPVLVLSGAEFNQQHGLHDHQSVAKSLAERSCDPRSRSDRAPAHVRRSLEAVHVVSRRTGALATVDREPLAAKLAQIFID
jgi:hypothetical protein